MDYLETMDTLIGPKEKSADDKKIEQFRNDMIRSIKKDQSELCFWEELGQKYKEIRTDFNDYIKKELAADESFILDKCQQIKTSKKMELTPYADQAKDEIKYIYQRIVHLEETKSLEINPNRINSAIIDYMKTLDQNRKLAEQGNHAFAKVVLSTELKILVERMREHKQQISQYELIIGVIAAIDAFQQKMESTKTKNLSGASRLLDQITTIENMTIALGYSLWAAQQADVEDIKEQIKKMQNQMKDLKKELDDCIKTRRFALGFSIICGIIGVIAVVLGVVCLCFCPLFSVPLFFLGGPLVAVSVIEGREVAKLDAKIRQLQEAMDQLQHLIDHELEHLKKREQENETDRNFIIFDAVAFLHELKIKNIIEVGKSLEEALKENCNQLQDLVDYKLIEKEKMEEMNDKKEIDIRVSVFVFHAKARLKVQPSPLLIWDYLEGAEKKTDERKHVFRLLQRMLEYEESSKKTRGVEYVSKLAKMFETEITA